MFRVRLWVIGLTFMACGLIVHGVCAWNVVPAGGGAIEVGQFACCGGYWFIAGLGLLFLHLVSLDAKKDPDVPVGCLWLLWILGVIVAAYSTLATLPDV